MSLQKDKKEATESTSERKKYNHRGRMKKQRFGMRTLEKTTMVRQKTRSELRDSSNVQITSATFKLEQCRQM